MKKFGKKIKKFVFRKKNMPVLIFMFFCLAVCFRIVAPHVGKAMGNSVGTKVGKGIGSYQGITKGVVAGTTDGKETGLSAEDTVAAVKTNLIHTGQLQVLTAGIKLTNFHEVGNDYAALYVLDSSAVFTLDLKSSSVDYDQENSSIVISVPKPQFEVYMDENKVEKIAEYQKHEFAGSAKDGMKAYLNSLAQSEEEIHKSISQDERLMEQAVAAAQNQIQALAQAIRGNALSITVRCI